jgi:ketosteroid isomerase-like protein
VVWTIAGSGPSAGVYRGRQDFLDRAVAPFRARLAAPLVPTVLGVWADGDQVIARWDGRATAGDGRPYRNSYVWLFTMRGGRAAAVTAFLDLPAYDAVLARVRPAPRPRTSLQTGPRTGDRVAPADDASVAPRSDAAPAGPPARACATDGDAAVAALHRAWILVGWEARPGDPPFSFRDKLGKYYDWAADNVLLYDDLDPAHRVARSPGAYGAAWEPIFRQNRSAHHRVLEGPSVVYGGELAASNLTFAARIERADGTVVGIRTFTLLVWRCTADGWKIVREHNSSVTLAPGELDAVMRATP